MVKVISLSDRAYEALKRRKYHGKSFSDVVLDLTEKKEKPSIMESFGILKDDKNAIDSLWAAYHARGKIKGRDIQL